MKLNDDRDQAPHEHNWGPYIRQCFGCGNLERLDEELTNLQDKLDAILNMLKKSGYSEID